MFTRKKKPSALTEEIQKITDDYEKLAKEQKDRILALREENRQLHTRLDACLQEKEAIASTLLRAEQTSQQLLEQTKQRCEQLLSGAHRKEENSQKRIEAHQSTLRELAVQCENILNGIESELKHPAGFPLELITKKKQA